MTWAIVRDHGGVGKMPRGSLSETIQVGDLFAATACVVRTRGASQPRSRSADWNGGNL